MGIKVQRFTYHNLSVKRFEVDNFEVNKTLYWTFKLRYAISIMDGSKARILSTVWSLDDTLYWTERNSIRFKCMIVIWCTCWQSSCWADWRIKDHIFDRLRLCFRRLKEELKQSVMLEAPWVYCDPTKMLPGTINHCQGTVESSHTIE